MVFETCPLGRARLRGQGLPAGMTPGAAGVREPPAAPLTRGSVDSICLPDSRRKRTYGTLMRFVQRNVERISFRSRNNHTSRDDGSSRSSMAFPAQRGRTAGRVVVSQITVFLWARPLPWTPLPISQSRNDVAGRPPGPHHQHHMSHNCRSDALRPEAGCFLGKRAAPSAASGRQTCGSPLRIRAAARPKPRTRRDRRSAERAGQIRYLAS